MNRIPPRAAHRRRAVLFALLFALVAALVAAVAYGSRTTQAAGAPQGPKSPADDEVLRAGMAQHGAGDASLTPPDVDPGARSAVDVPVPTPRSFEERIDRLVALGTRTAEFAQAEDFPEARRADDEARAEFAELLQAFVDAGERALALLSAEAPAEPTAPGVAASPVDPVAAGRPIVLQLVIAAECHRRHEAAVAAADHGRSEPFVQAILDVLPQTTAIAEIAGEVLIDRPYLRAPHEPAVLSLAQFAGEGRVPRRIATKLLLTLWDNLQRTGVRTSDELSRLAMLLLADGDPSKRIAACRHLLADPRYRPMMLAWLREQTDRTVGAEIAGIAASELAPADALQVLRELAPLLPRAPNAYMVLGSRAPELLDAEYQHLLATDTRPDVRADLVAGVGFASPRGRELADLALQHDPSPDVRIQAAFVLTATGAADGERAVHQLLDDPTIVRDPARLGALVLALQNLEAAGDANAIDRLGQRLRNLPLSDASREALAALLARSLPRGGAAPVAGTPPSGDPPAGR